MMKKPGFLSLCSVASILAFGSLTLVGQSRPAPPLVVTAHNGGPAVPYAVPKTPWGDPDLQGVWSSDDTSGIPRERPKDLGTRLYQTDEDFARASEAVERGVKRGEGDIGSFRNDFARRAFRQTSLIVDPPDGSMPAFTPEAREAPRAARPRHLRRRSVRHARRTSRSTTAASRAASSARCCASSTATATASCRRRAWSPSATR